MDVLKPNEVPYIPVGLLRDLDRLCEAHGVGALPEAFCAALVKLIETRQRVASKEGYADGFSSGRSAERDDLRERLGF